MKNFKNTRKLKYCFINKWTLITIVAIIVAVSSPIVFAQEMMTVEGVIQGANCVHNKTGCPDSRIDVHIAMEHDFVLLMAEGNHYFLPNLDRAVKARYVTREMRISGKKEGHGIWVDVLEVKEGKKYRKVWSWEEEQELYKGGN